MYQIRKFNLGVSVLNLVKPKWNFNSADVSKSTVFNYSASYKVFLNSSNTLKLLPIIISSVNSEGIGLGANLKVEFSGYEGFEGKLYFGVEYLNSNRISTLSSGVIYLGYSQDNITFHYGYGSPFQYMKQLGVSNFLILSYNF